MKRSGSRKGADGLGSDDDVAAKLRALEQMDGPALRREWRRLYRCHPCRAQKPHPVDHAARL